MIPSFRHYLNSFRFGRKFWSTFSIDVLAVAFISVLFIAFTSYLKLRTDAISGGRSVEELKVALLASSLENSQLFLSQVKMLALVMIFGTVILLIVAVMSWSFSRYWVWNLLLEQPLSRRKYWRWNLMTLLLGIMASLFLLVYVLVRVILNMFLSIRSDTVYAILMQFLNGFFLLIFIFLMILLYHCFVQKYRVFESVGNAFALIKSRRSILWKMFLFAFITGVLLSVASYYLQNYFWRYQPPWVHVIISLLILFLFLSWLRFYLFSTLHGSQHVSKE